MSFVTHVKFVPGLASSLITLLLLPLFVYLGSWQYQRMTEKTKIEAKLKESVPIEWQASIIENHFTQYRYQTLKIPGQFLQGKDILLDNQTLKGQVGYRVFTPFLPNDSKRKILLVDRGWIPAQKRSQLPTIEAITQPIVLIGKINKLSNSITLKEEVLPEHLTAWPIRLQTIPLERVSHWLGNEIYPFTLQLADNSPAVYAALPLNIGISSLRHLGYALQWFTMAAAVLIYYLAINLKNSRRV